jgi:hypothetical protein
MPEKKPVLILVGDFRICGFDTFKYENFRTWFVIERGALIKDVVEKTLDIVREYCVQNRDVIVKIAFGVTEYTKFESINGKRFLRFHSVKSRSVIGKLKSFKDKIKSIRPQTVVGFITVPTLSFRNYQDFRITEKYHKSKANIGFSDEDLQNDQRKLDVELIGLNADIKLENSRKQSGLLKGCFTISWHNSISRESRRKRRSGSRKVVRNDFKELYDGLHATRTLKRKWHKQLLKCATSELKLIKHNLKTTKVTVKV